MFENFKSVFLVKVLLFMSHILKVLDCDCQRFAIYFIFGIIETGLNFLFIINSSGPKLNSLIGVEIADFFNDFFTFGLQIFIRLRVF
jgi:hypothetical protein